MSYNVPVRREQGGKKLVVASSGELEVLSGGVIDIQAGSSFSCATDIEMQSGASIVYAAGSAFKVPIQTLTSTQTGTNITNFGLSVLTGTTTGPTYTLAAPVVGVQKYLSLTHSSSGATHRAVVNSNTTGVSFDTTGGNQLTFATSALRGISLVAQTTAKWRIVGVYSGASLAGQKTT